MDIKNTIQHILLVDEPGADQVDLIQAIKRAGYRVTEVFSRDDALAVLQKVSIDLVVTELMMPDINGWDLLGEIKAQFPDIHVVVMTGHVSEDAEDILTNMKADGYLVKPVIPERVRVLFRALLDPQNLDRDAEVVLLTDSEAMGKEIGDILGDRGLHVMTFSNTKSLLRHIRLDPPELVVINLLAKISRELEPCRMVRFTKETIYTPILLIVDHPSRTLVEKAVRLRVNGILASPFSAQELGNRAIHLVRQADVRKNRHRLHQKDS